MHRQSFIASILAALTGCARRTAGRGTVRGMMSGIMGSSSSGLMGESMMSVSPTDMRIYLEMFDHHTEIRRSVEPLVNGVRTTTESDNPHIARLLHEHVPSMYRHVTDGREVRCMSDSLPTLFRNGSKYRRHLTLTAKGVAVEETSDDPLVLGAIHHHADEVSGFVREGMPAMMREMMR